MSINPIQSKMLEERDDELLYQKANDYGLKYSKKNLSRHVYPHDDALKELSIFDESFPNKSGNAHAILELLHKYGAPATVAQTGGRYFGFVNGSVVPVSLAAKNLASFWDQNTALQVISPFSSKLETVVQKWLIKLFGLPKNTVTGFVSGTSMANFCGLSAARYRILSNRNWDVTELGLNGAPPIRVVTGRQAHSSVIKAISLVGLGKKNIEWVDVDAEGRIIVEQIPPLDQTCILILQAGNVHTGSFDDFDSICKKANESGAWIHVDGAFGLWAGATKKLKHLTKGYQYAHSWAVDGHKTLNTPYDSGIILCNDEEALVSSMHMSGGYIIQGDGRDGMYYTPEMSRRSRIIELWATLKYLGHQGIDEMIFGMHQNAKLFAKLLSSKSDFKVLNEVVFNQVMVQCETDSTTTEVLEQIQQLRTCWVGGSTWKGRKVIRISVCSWVTTEEDVRLSAESFNKAIAMTRISS